MIDMINRYKRPDTHGGTMRTPIRFLSKDYSSPYPHERKTKEKFFTLAEVYSSSVADIQGLSSTQSKNAVTLIFNYPYGVQISNKDVFKIEDGIFAGNKYEVQSVGSVYKQPGKVKIVGVSYE